MTLDALDSEARLVAIVKTIGELDELALLIVKMLPRTMTWQRQLVSNLADLDRTIQVLRMTVVMCRPDQEIGAAAEEVEAASRRADAAITGTRADLMTKSSVRLLAQLGQKLGRLLSQPNVLPHD